jgi:SAM-dependent methyltransferase
VFLYPRPTREGIVRLYPPTYHNFEPPAGAVSRFLVGRYYAHHAAICRRHLPSGGSLLEIGAAGGDLLARLRVYGYRVRGVEVSAAGCALAREKGLDVFHGTVEEFETDERFDMVFMSHVIEHVLDPVATVTRIRGLLTEGGVLYVETPNVGSPDARLWRRHWGLLHYPRHLYLFDRATLRRLLETGGFLVERAWSEFNSCGWALSVQCVLRRVGLDRSRRPRSFYYSPLLLACLPLNLLDLVFGGTAFMAALARTGGR